MNLKQIVVAKFRDWRTQIIKWCVDEKTITIGELHTLHNPVSADIYNGDQLKFVEKTNVSNTFVKTDIGWSPIKHSMKTVEYRVFKVVVGDKTIECADEHILIDAHHNQVFVKDLVVGQLIKTDCGLQPVISVEELAHSEQMYDLHLDDDRRVYYTNGILSHNSTISAIYLLWFAMFRPDMTILIASNKNKGAMEMIQRIRYAYEELPWFLKPGVNDDGWSKHTIAFDNGSRIESTATTESSGRGMSISLLYLDEFAFVLPSIQEEFWTAIMPTLSTGGSCIMSSTPNGNTDLFAQLWRSAECGKNNDGLAFAPMHIKWDEPPGRDEAFKQSQIKLIGDLKWKQEYECLGSTTDVIVKDDKDRMFAIGIEELYEEMKIYQDLPLSVALSKFSDKFRRVI